MFTIDSDNNIAVCAEAPASTEGLQMFASEKELARLGADWPAARLIEVWNGFAGAVPLDDLRPVKKFTSRKLAVARIWAAVQRLAAEAAEPARDIAPAAKPARKSPIKAPRRARAQKDADESRSNKKAEVIALMKRAKGVTLAEIMEHTGWQKLHPRLCQHPGEQGRAQGRVREELRRRAHVSRREVALRTGRFLHNAASGSPPGAAFLLSWRDPSKRGRCRGPGSRGGTACSARQSGSRCGQ